MSKRLNNDFQFIEVGRVDPKKVEMERLRMFIKVGVFPILGEL